jgi:uncharacterized protein (DUF1697 family)
MKTYVVLLRGVNVGGKNILPMKDLKKTLEDNNFENIKTYIQSGNIVLSFNQNPVEEIAKLIQAKFGFTPKILAFSKHEFITKVDNNPYQEYEGKFVHLYFCKTAPKIDSNKLHKYTSKTESHTLIDNVFYIHAPEGVARSKLVANIESCLGVTATGRNLNTANKLLKMINT